MRAALELLQVASSERPVFEPSGLLRLAITDQQKAAFRERSCDYLPQATPLPAMWTSEGITVYSRLYLEGLWKACSKAHRVDRSVSLPELENFDAIVLASGADTLQFEECRHLPLKRTIGQSLICRWPERLPFALLGLGHIVPTEDAALCQVGSTYEHTAQPDPQQALQLLDKCARFYPPAKEFEIVEIRSGVRMSPKLGSQPLVAKVAPKIWVFSGLGSRGLLYHALLAKELAQEINSPQAL
jgi:glycine/D-amino acid oxidase-like deaminating enzyme